MSDGLAYPEAMARLAARLARPVPAPAPAPRAAESRSGPLLDRIRRAREQRRKPDLTKTVA